MKKPVAFFLLLSLVANVLAVPPTRDTSLTQQQKSPAALTNADITDMLTAGLAPEIVIAKIKTSDCTFDTSPTARQELKKLAVPDAVILAMVQAPAAGTKRDDGDSSPLPILSPTADRGIELVIPDGTPFNVTTTEEISSKTATEGDPLTFKVADDVTINGNVVIAKGAVVKGSVSNAEKNGRMGKGGKLSIRVESAMTVDGQPIKLRSSKGKEGGDSTGSVIALSLLISPLFLLKHGSNAKIKTSVVPILGTDVFVLINLKSS